MCEFFENKHNSKFKKQYNKTIFILHSSQSILVVYGDDLSFNKWSLTHLSISLKETSFTCNKIESLREIPLRRIPDMLP